MHAAALPVTLLLALTSVPTRAGDTSADHVLSANVSITSDYRYRGISQSRLRPALAGGADYVHTPSGIYAGAWGSTIRWTGDAGGDGDIEIDLYAGQRGQLGAAFSYDLGVLHYAYPSNGLERVNGFANASTTEVYGQLGTGPAYIKYSSALTNLFGFIDSKHSSYLDAGANIELAPGTTLNLHAGRQRIRHNAAASYTDWKLGLTRELGFASASLAWVATNASESTYASPANGKFTARQGLVISLAKTF